MNIEISNSEFWIFKLLIVTFTFFVTIIVLFKLLWAILPSSVSSLSFRLGWVGFIPSLSRHRPRCIDFLLEHQVFVFWSFCIFAFCSICILFHLYFVAIVFCYICILAICILSFCILSCLYFGIFVFCSICIFSHLYFGIFVFCQVVFCFVWLYFVLFVLWNICICICIVFSTYDTVVVHTPTPSWY